MPSASEILVVNTDLNDANLNVETIVFIYLFMHSQHNPTRTLSLSLSLPFCPSEQCWAEQKI